jgi:glycosyltransferase involved in cell wall biosynthesis
LPLAVLEAMAAGVPLVATAIGGTDEAVVDGVTGLLVPPSDAAALARAVERVLADPREARDRADAAAERVKTDFSADTMAARVESIYTELLEGGEHDARS